MTRKTMIFAVVALALIVSVAAVAGITIAQKAQVAYIAGESSGDIVVAVVNGAEDIDVVAVVNGTIVFREDIRSPAEFHQTVNPDLTNDDATKLVIVSVIDDVLIDVEVERRGLTPSDAAATTFMEPHKEACLGPNGQGCRDHITSLGITVEDYWDNALPDYKRDLGSMKLFQDVFDEEAPENATHEQLIDTENAFRGQLRTNATITWNDEDLQRMYEQALASE